MPCRPQPFLFAMLFLLFLPLAARASETPAERAADVYASHQLASQPLHANLPDYALSPASLIKSQHLNSIRLILHFGEELWSIAGLLLLLRFGIMARMRDAAVRLSPRRLLQSYTFVFLYLLADAVLSFPLSVYAYHMERVYGLSVQRWSGWFVDGLKSFGLTWLIGGLLVFLLFAIIRRFPRRWWLVFWVAAIPITLAAVFAVPYVNLLFDHFEPLSLHHAELVSQLEQVVARGHMNIPPDRMFLMKGSEKTTTMNAYVTGLGASKRVVVWDTSLTKGTPDEVLFIFGHESGHYVLHHIVEGVCFSFAGLLVSLYLGYRFVHWALTRYGVLWRIPAQTDWAALGVLLLAFSLLTLASEPIQSAISRHDEHAADIYGQEAIHGLVPDPQVTAQRTFDVLGASAYADPNPNRFYEFWAYSHPSIGRRAAFAHAYNPWAPGMQPKYFSR
jgi:STE24 endopeptidase